MNMLFFFTLFPKPYTDKISVLNLLTQASPLKSMRVFICKMSTSLHKDVLIEKNWVSFKLTLEFLLSSRGQMPLQNHKLSSKNVEH